MNDCPSNSYHAKLQGPRVVGAHSESPALGTMLAYLVSGC